MAELQAGSEFAGYRVEGIAGRGGMGVVYRATQVALDRLVALKLISPDFAEDPAFRDRFKRESRLAAKIEHPHVITVYEAGEADGQLFISMRYIEGTDLRQLLTREGGLAPERTAGILAQVASALDAAHSHGLIHRDVKPANVLIAANEDDDHAFLTDFGLTKHLAASTSGMTKTGTWVGTLDYVAPEQISGRKVDARSDIYSLGCVLYQTLTGTAPFPRDSDVAKLWAHMHDPPPALSEARPDLPPQLEGVVQRAMAKEPEDRYLSAGDLGRAAMAAVQGEMLTQTERSVATGAAAPQPTGAAASAPSARPGGRRRWLAPLLAGLALVAALGIGLLIGGSGGDGDGGSSGPADFGDFEQVTLASIPFQNPAGVTEGDGSAWVSSYEGDKLLKVDTESGATTEFADVGDGPTALALSSEYLWVAQSNNGTIGRFSLESEQLVGNPIQVAANEGNPLALGEDGLWVATDNEGKVSLLDTETGKVLKTIKVPGGVRSEIAVAGTKVWVVNSTTPTVTPIDTKTMEPGEPVEIGNTSKDDFAAEIAFGEEGVWVASLNDETVTRLDPATGAVKATIKMPLGVGGDITAGNGYVWVTDDNEWIDRINPSDNKPLTPGGSPPGGVGHLFAGDSALWATSESDQDIVTRVGF